MVELVSLLQTCLNCFDHFSVHAQSVSRVRLFEIPWTVAHKAPLSMEFSSQKYHSLLQGIFPTQGLNPGLLQYRQILYHLSQQRSPVMRLGSILIHCDLISTWLYKQRPYFPIRSHSEAPGVVRTSIYLFGKQFNPQHFGICIHIATAVFLGFLFA